MLKTSDKVRNLIFSLVVLLPSIASAQSMSVRFDSEAYNDARVNPNVVYFRMTYDPPTNNPDSSSRVVDLSYVYGRPASATSMSLFGFYTPGNYSTRYILIDGSDLLLARSSGMEHRFLPLINENLASFGLATSEERLRAIDIARGIVTMPAIVDSSNVQSTLGSIIVSWLKIAMSLGVAFYALWTGYSVLKAFLASRSTDSSEEWRDYAGEEAELYSSEQEWVDSIMARNHLETEWAENRKAARERGEKLAVPKVYLGEDPEGNALYID